MTAERSLRVLLVTKGLDIGGIERMVVDLALGLAGRGLAVDVAIVNGARDAMVPLLERAGITVHRLEGHDRIGVRAARRLVQLCRSPRYDVVHVHGPLPTVVARLSPGGRPVVSTSHTTWSGLRPSTRALWIATVRRDAATIAVSEVVAASLPPSARRRARVVPHGLDRAVVRAAAQQRATTEAAMEPTAGERSRPPVTAIAVASHREVKNYPGLLSAVAAVRADGLDLRLVAIGTGPQLDANRALADELGLADAVEFLPPALDVLGSIAAADLLVVASDFEGQPLVVVEALALGVPVVATAVGRVPELVDDEVGRVVPPGDAHSLATALRDVAGDDELRRGMSANALVRAAGWSLDDVLDAHTRIYGEVAR